MAEADIYKTLLDFLKTDTRVTETFDTYPSAAPPPAPWATELNLESYTKVRNDQAALGSVRSCKMHSGDLETRANLKLPSMPLTLPGRTVFDTAFRIHGAHAQDRYIKLYDNTNHDVLCTVYWNHLNAHLYALDGVAPRDLGPCAVDTWHSLALYLVHIPGTAVGWSARLNTAFYPNVLDLTLMALSGGGTVPDDVQFLNEFTSDDLWVDDFRLATEDWFDDMAAYAPGGPPPSPPYNFGWGGGGSVRVVVLGAPPPFGIQLRCPAAPDSAWCNRDLTWPTPAAPRAHAWHKFSWFMKVDRPPAVAHSSGLRFRDHLGATMHEVTFHTDGHIYATDGAFRRDLGGFVDDTQYVFEAWFDPDNTKYFLYVNGVRFPNVGYYDVMVGGPYGDVHPTNAHYFSVNLVSLTFSWTFSGKGVFADLFETDTLDAIPPAPWFAEYSSLPTAVIDPAVHFGATGKSLKLDNTDRDTHARSYRSDWVIPPDSKVTMQLQVSGFGVIGVCNRAYGFRTRNSASGLTGAQIAVHTDGHLWAADGAGYVDLGAFSASAWHSAVVHLRNGENQYWVEYNALRWPLTGYYSYQNAEASDQVVWFNEKGGDNFWIDSLEFSEEEYLTGVRYIVEYPHLDPFEPQIVFRIKDYGQGQAWTGKNAAGRLGYLRPCIMEFIGLVPWFKSAQDILQDCTETQQLDLVLKVTRNRIQRGFASLTNLVDIQVSMLSQTVFLENINALAKSFQIKFKHHEEV